MTNDQVINFLKKTKIDVQNGTACLFICDLVFSAYANSDKAHKIKYSPVFCYMDNGSAGNFYQLLMNDKVEEIAKKVYLDYKKNAKTFDGYITSHKDVTKQIDDIWSDYQKNKESANDKKLSIIYSKLLKSSVDWWHYGVIGEDKGEVINKEVVPNFMKRHGMAETTAREIVSLLSHPATQSVLNLERIDFFNVCLSVLSCKNKKVVELLKDKNVLKKVELYIKNNFWIKSNFYKATQVTPKNLIEDVLKEIAKKDKKKILREIKEVNDNFNRIHKDQTRTKAKIKLSKEDKNEINFSQKTAYWVDWRKLGMMKQLYYIFSFVEDVANKFNISYHDISFYTVKEIMALLKNDKRINSKELRKREAGVFMMFEKNKDVKFFYGNDGKKMFNIAKHVDHGNDIKGMIASTGKSKIVRGNVCLVKDPQKDKFTKGDILVTSMTRVEFVPLMRIASGIITNEGGIACHAAIVSRELGIPCIIGTKVATEILKNNDRVEMNMESGVVKIIK